MLCKLFVHWGECVYGTYERSLDHWLFSRTNGAVPIGLRNAGFNLVELPRSMRLTWGYFGGDVNRFVGLAARWRGHPLQSVALSLRRQITLGIPALGLGSFGVG